MNLQAAFAPLEQVAEFHSTNRAGADGWEPIKPPPGTEIDRGTLNRFAPSGYKLVTVWAYLTESGSLLHYTARYDAPPADGEKPAKKVLPFSFCAGPGGRSEWRSKASPNPRPLYGLDRLAARPGAPVIVVEGEKKVDPAGKRFPDYVPVTSSGGSNAAPCADWTPLAGREVTVWRDADKPGETYEKDVVAALFEAGASSVRTVQIPGHFPTGWDLADELPPGIADAELTRLLTEAAQAAPNAAEENADAAEVARLAALTLVEYDRQRIDAAKMLGIRSAVLDSLVRAERGKNGERSGTAKQGRPINIPEPEPWPEKVIGTVLLGDLATAIRSHVVTSAEAADAIALWAAHTYFMDVNTISPRLAITSPEKGCGKTTLLDVLTRLVYRPLLASNISTSSTFRVVEAVQPCLLIDEADTYLPENEELRGVLNSGHRRGTSVIRCVGDDNTPRQFSVWAAAAIAMIGKLPATLEDRAVAIELHRRLPDEPLRELEYDNTPHLNRLARMAARWAGDNRTAIREAKPNAAGLYNRQRDNWKPLMAVAEVAGSEWPRRAMAAARATSPSGGEQSRGVALLTDIRAIFADRNADRMSSAALVEALVAMEGRPWAEYRSGKPITTNGLARALGPFKINPGTIRTDTGEKDTAKGYYLRLFDEAFRRYLPQQGESNRHNVTSLVRQGFAADEQPSQPETLLRLGIPENPRDSAACDGVTVGSPPPAVDEVEIEL